MDGYTQRSIEDEVCESMTVVTNISVHQQTMVVPVLTTLREWGEREEEEKDEEEQEEEEEEEEEEAGRGKTKGKGKSGLVPSLCTVRNHLVNKVEFLGLFPKSGKNQ